MEARVGGTHGVYVGGQGRGIEIEVVSIPPAESLLCCPGMEHPRPLPLEGAGNLYHRRWGSSMVLGGTPFPVFAVPLFPGAVGTWVPCMMGIKMGRHGVVGVIDREGRVWLSAAPLGLGEGRWCPRLAGVPDIPCGISFCPASCLPTCWPTQAPGALAQQPPPITAETSRSACFSGAGLSLSFSFAKLWDSLKK